MYMDHVYEVCPEKMDSANEWAEGVDFEWTPEKLEDEAKQWAENNDCLGDEDLDKSGSDWSNWDDYYDDEEYWTEDMDTYAMMDMYMDHVYEVCPEKMDSANEWAEGVDFEWTPEKLEDEAMHWAENNDCLGDEDLDKSG